MGANPSGNKSYPDKQQDVAAEAGEPTMVQLRRTLIALTIMLMVGVSGCAAQSGERERGERERGEHERGERGEHGEGGEENELKSSILAPGENWEGMLGDLRISMRYVSTSKRIQGTIENTSSETICYLQLEPHLKRGERTVGELGPYVLGNVESGQSIDVDVSVADDPRFRGVDFDGWQIHPEMYSCQGDGPGEGGHEGGEGEGGHEEGEGHEEGGERESHEEGRERGEHDEGGEREGGHDEGERREGNHGDSGDESGSTEYTNDETYDRVRYGIHLILKYDASEDAFIGTIENVTERTAEDVRVEVHLSNGTELGPTRRVDLKAGEKQEVRLDANDQRFEGWTAHPESGNGEEH